MFVMRHMLTKSAVSSSQSPQRFSTAKQRPAKVAALELHIVAIPFPKRAHLVPRPAVGRLLAQLLGQGDDLRMLGLEARRDARDLIAQLRGCVLRQAQFLGRKLELHAIPRDLIKPLDRGGLASRDAGEIHLQHGALPGRHLLRDLRSRRNLLAHQANFLLGPVDRNRPDRRHAHEIGFAGLDLEADLHAIGARVGVFHRRIANHFLRGRLEAGLGFGSLIGFGGGFDRARFVEFGVASIGGRLFLRLAFPGLAFSGLVVLSSGGA